MKILRMGRVKSIFCRKSILFLVFAVVLVPSALSDSVYAASDKKKKACGIALSTAAAAGVLAGVWYFGQRVPSQAHQAISSGAPIAEIEAYLDRSPFALASTHDDVFLLHRAIIEGREDVVRLLISRAFQRGLRNVSHLLDRRDKDGNAALHLAVIHDQPEIVKLLLASGARLNDELKEMIERAFPDVDIVFWSNLSNLRSSPQEFQRAAQNYFWNRANHLLRSGWSSSSGGSAAGTVYWSTYKNSEEAISELRALIIAGFDVNAKNEDGLTALHLAIMNRNIEIVQLLLEFDANPWIQNSAGESAMDLLIKREPAGTSFFKDVHELISKQHPAAFQARSASVAGDAENSSRASRRGANERNQRPAYFFDPSDFQVADRFNVRGWIGSADTDSGWMTSSFGYNSKVSFFNTHTGQLIGEVQVQNHGGPVWGHYSIVDGIAYAPDGENLHIIDLNSGSHRKISLPTELSGSDWWASSRKIFPSDDSHKLMVMLNRTFWVRATETLVYRSHWAEIDLETGEFRMLHSLPFTGGANDLIQVGEGAEARFLITGFSSGENTAPGTEALALTESSYPWRVLDMIELPSRFSEPGSWPSSEPLAFGEEAFFRVNSEGQLLSYRVASNKIEVNRLEIEGLSPGETIQSVLPMSQGRYLMQARESNRLYLAELGPAGRVKATPLTGVEIDLPLNSFSTELIPIEQASDSSLDYLIVQKEEGSLGRLRVEPAAETGGMTASFTPYSNLQPFSVKTYEDDFSLRDAAVSPDGTQVRLVFQNHVVLMDLNTGDSKVILRQEYSDNDGVLEEEYWPVDFYPLPNGDLMLREPGMDGQIIQLRWRTGD